MPLENFGRGPISASPPPQLPADLGKDAPPLSANKLYISPHNKEQLAIVGWKEGDPVPPELSGRLKEIRDANEAERRAAKPHIPAGFVPPTPKVVDIATLKPEQQAEIRKMLEDHKILATSTPPPAAAVQFPDTMHPEARTAAFQQAKAQEAWEARQAAARTTGSTVDDVQVRVIDDAAQPPPATQAAPSPQPAAPQVVAEDMQQFMTGADQATHTCPRCGWDVRQTFADLTTDGDKRAFVATILGARFTREFHFFGGQLRVVFRTLRASETQAVQLQLREENRRGELMDERALFSRLYEYRYLLSLSQLIVGDSEIYSIPEQLSAVQYSPASDGAPPEPTCLPDLRAWLSENVLAQEAVTDVLSVAYRQFQQIVASLEARAAEPDFWKGIELPR